MITEKELNQAKEIYKQLFNDEINITKRQTDEFAYVRESKSCISFDEGYFLYKTNGEWVAATLDFEYNGKWYFTELHVTENTFECCLRALFNMMFTDDMNKIFELYGDK
jgi:hypothetical protein